jgi:hypothetical protein
VNAFAIGHPFPQTLERRLFRLLLRRAKNQ